MIDEIWLNLDPQIIISTFKKAGIYLFPNNVIRDSMFNVVTLKQWKGGKCQKCY